MRHDGAAHAGWARGGGEQGGGEQGGGIGGGDGDGNGGEDRGEAGAGAEAGGAAAVGWEDVLSALTRVGPSALRELQLQVPRVTWDDIGGQDELKAALREAVQWPLQHAAAFERLGVRPPRGVLLYGPPGCSKTLAAKALAGEARTNFIAVKGPELFSKYVGESERAVASLFAKARAAAPAIVFFDEIDALAASRDGGGGGGGGVGARVLSQLLSEMDGIQPLQAVLVVAATNRPDLVDAALLRPGRFDRLVHVTLPDGAAREAVLRIHTRRTPLAADVDLAALAARTGGYSGAELAAVCREAALGALEHSLDAQQVGAAHFDAALRLVRPRTDAATLRFYAEYERRSSSVGGGGGAAGAATAAAPAAATAPVAAFEFEPLPQGAFAP